MKQRSISSSSPDPKSGRSSLAFDLDGTVTREEILPAIARELDLFDEMSLLTDLTLRGEISFERSFRLRFQILRNVPLARIQDITGSVRLDPDIAAFIRAEADRCFIVTGNLDLWVAPLMTVLPCRWFCSKGHLGPTGAVELGEVQLKSRAIRELRSSGSDVVAIGDSSNDVPMFEEADVGIAYGGVHEPVAALHEMADYVVYDGATLCRLLATL